jgi:hypothetical protein
MELQASATAASNFQQKENDSITGMVFLKKY